MYRSQQTVVQVCAKSYYDAHRWSIEHVALPIVVLSVPVEHVCTANDMSNMVLLHTMRQSVKGRI
jgi:hypothetical protein